MAWIETAYSEIINTDNVRRITVENIDGKNRGDADKRYWLPCATFSDGDVSYLCEEGLNFEDAWNLAVKIAQIARGNAYISQDDIRRMLGESD